MNAPTTTPAGDPADGKSIDNWVSQARHYTELLPMLNAKVQALEARFDNFDGTPVDRSHHAAAVKAAREHLKNSALLALESLLHVTELAGLLVTVQQVPLHPASEGRYSTAVSIRQARL